ncbi:hypothetical protein HPB48_022650 [Haemaphysalis longicornis]|uniref:Uncharacterized protein n=1 Tax=Haemaphysalis longicornis TaxID=44386 RepID=A0A9J6GZJ1_HAELO|nr:hypothetical protein HPB48_022650 [Haemaphysalis longicornis]
MPSSPTCAAKNEAKEPPKQGAAKQIGDKRPQSGCFACGARSPKGKVPARYKKAAKLGSEQR